MTEWLYGLEIFTIHQITDYFWLLSSLCLSSQASIPNE